VLLCVCGFVFVHMCVKEQECERKRKVGCIREEKTHRVKVWEGLAVTCSVAQCVLQCVAECVAACCSELQ